MIDAGGFYISRFEAGKETVDGEDKLVSKKGAKIWNNISQEDSKTEAKAFINNDSVKSALCSGIQWDVTMSFVNGKEDGSDDEDKIFDVTKYKDSRHANTEAISGNNEDDKVCNIYDLEGNYYEYVAEKNSNYTDTSFIGRGGSYSRSGHVSASNRERTYGTAATSSSFRFILYVIPRNNWTPSYDEQTTYTDANGDTATIPVGFSVSRKPNEKTIDDGLVVKAPDGSEFVWVPVEDINTMSQCSTAGGDCNLQLQGDELICTTHNSTEIVGKLYFNATRTGRNRTTRK